MSIDLIRAKQQQIAAEIRAKKAAERVREETAVQAFAHTGIPAIWEDIKDIKVPHWRGNGSRENDVLVEIPLAEHAKSVTNTMIRLLNHDGGVKVSWYTHVTDKGAVRYCVEGRIDRKEFHTPEDLRAHFVEYMATFLPPLEDADAKV